jgi:diamine N-acetyltransferase
MFTIYRAKPVDCAVLRDLAITTFCDTYQAHNTPENMRDYLATHFSMEQLLSEINHPAMEYYLVEMNNTVVAYLKLNLPTEQTDQQYPNAVEIERLYVLPAYKGKSIGSLLIHFALDLANKFGLSAVWLGVWERNEAAIAFYKKQGFQVVGTHIFQFGDDAQTDFVMERLITNY